MARPVASLFNDDPAVISAMVLYLRIVPLAFGLQGILSLSMSVLNVLNKPLHAAALLVVQMVFLFVPLAYLGSALYGLTGIFCALAVVYALGGTASYWLLRDIIARLTQ